MSAPNEKERIFLPMRSTGGNSKHLLFCGPSDRPPRRRHVVVSFRLPRSFSQELHCQAREEDMTFSQFVRRAIRRQLQAHESATAK
jgi:hypothetical protein